MGSKLSPTASCRGQRGPRDPRESHSILSALAFSHVRAVSRKLTETGSVVMGQRVALVGGQRAWGQP